MAEKKFTAPSSDTVFDFWMERWQKDIDEYQRRINYVKKLTFKTIVKLEIDFTHGKDSIRLKYDCVALTIAVNNKSFIGEPIAMNHKMGKHAQGDTAFHWESIKDIKIFPRENFPLLLNYPCIFPLFDKIMKGQGF